jgi:hypothetical protein
VRANAFYSDVFDIKTTHLILFGLLFCSVCCWSNTMPRHRCAVSPRGAGATWQELHKIVEFAAAPMSLDRPIKASSPTPLPNNITGAESADPALFALRQLLELE